MMGSLKTSGMRIISTIFPLTRVKLDCKVIRRVTERALVEVREKKLFEHISILNFLYFKLVY